MAITVHTKYLGEGRTEMKHLRSGNKVITDAPVDNHGRGEYFSPTDLVTAALASCMLTIMGQAGEVHGFEINGAEVDITKIMGDGPRRIIEIIMEISFPHDYEAKHRKIIELAAHQCPVANSLHPDVKQTAIFHYGPAQ